MDYKAMWEELKLKIKSDWGYYENGRMCSMSESINGMLHCEAMLKDMEILEEKYNA